MSIFPFSLFTNCNFLDLMRPDQSHSSVERAGMLGGVKMRLIRSDKEWRLRGEPLKMAIEADKAKGLIPFFVKPNYR